MLQENYEDGTTLLLQYTSLFRSDLDSDNLIAGAHVHDKNG